MKIPRGASLVFETTSDDYRGHVLGPDVDKQVKTGRALPTDAKGFYTLSVMDRQLRSLSVSLKSELGKPTSEKRTRKELVTLQYEVA